MTTSLALCGSLWKCKSSPLLCCSITTEKTKNIQFRHRSRTQRGKQMFTIITAFKSDWITQLVFQEKICSILLFSNPSIFYRCSLYFSLSQLLGPKANHSTAASAFDKSDWSNLYKKRASVWSKTFLLVTHRYLLLEASASCQPANIWNYALSLPPPLCMLALKIGSGEPGKAQLRWHGGQVPTGQCHYVSAFLNGAFRSVPMRLCSQEAAWRWTPKNIPSSMIFAEFQLSKCTKHFFNTRPNPKCSIF